MGDPSKYHIPRRKISEWSRILEVITWRKTGNFYAALTGVAFVLTKARRHFNLLTEHIKFEKNNERGGL